MSALLESWSNQIEICMLTKISYFKNTSPPRFLDSRLGKFLPFLCSIHHSFASPASEIRIDLYRKDFILHCENQFTSPKFCFFTIFLFRNVSVLKKISVLLVVLAAHLGPRTFTECPLSTFFSITSTSKLSFYKWQN